MVVTPAPHPGLDAVPSHLRPTLAAAAMVLLLGGFATAFVLGAVPATAGPAQPIPVVRTHPDPLALPGCADVTEDSADPDCVATPADPVADPQSPDSPSRDPR